ncbi:DUF2815 family protein [Testudinibacter sp. P80/BLE/0925]|uniref:DUF2815 family protein n=1 Tax=Testudinibacter sp. TW-1 TaxID=3417757 RepID=UPI003D3646D9
MKVTLKDVRLAFPALFEAKTINGEGDPRFSAVLLFDKGSDNYNAVMSAMKAVAEDKWEEKMEANWKAIKAKNAFCLHDGAEKPEYEGFEGKFFVSAHNKARPKVVDRNRQELVQADGKPYAGCYVNAVIDIWAQDNKYGKRINASLSGIQFVRDGDAFAGGGVASADDFDDLSVDDSGADDFM